MKPGRELDALVAEKVMGQTVRLADDMGVDHDEGDFFVNKPDSKEPRWGHMLGLPHYSTDIAAAWAVVEKMQGLGWTFQVDDVGFNDSTEGKWRVVLTEETKGHDYHPADGDTAPHAICLAALKACG